MRKERCSSRRGNVARNGRRGAVALCAVLLAVPGQSLAALPQNDSPFDGLMPLANQQLAEMRGGMVFGGMRFDFAVEITTRVNKMVETAMGPMQESFGLMTKLKLDNAGQISEVQNQVSGTPDTTSLPSLGQLKDIQASIAMGNTEIIHRLAKDHLTAITSNADNQTSIESNASLTATAGNFSSLAKSFAAKSLISKISRLSGLAAISSR